MSKTLSLGALYFGVKRLPASSAADGPMHMIGKARHQGTSTERVAVKDMQLVYRACSSSFAEALGFNSPDLVIGRTDFDLLPHELATQQLLIDKRVADNAVSDLSLIHI